MSLTFAPDALLPHLHHFRSLDHVHTLIMEEFDFLRWTSHYQTCFTHFYPTLTSLTLSRCVDYDILLPRFVLQFTHLENLCIGWVWRIGLLPPPNSTVAVNQPPPLCGHLRLAGRHSLPQLATYFAHELLTAVKFRSVELEDFHGALVQPILNARAYALERLTIIPSSTGMHQLLFPSVSMAKLPPNFPLAGERELKDLSFRGLTTLHRLTLRSTSCYDVLTLEHSMLSRTLSAVQPPLFCELVFEVLGHSPQQRFYFDSSTWMGIDMFLGERCAEREDCRLIFRMEEVNGREIFPRHITNRFPRLQERGRIHFK